jgi:hypothetical protein
MKYYPKEYEDKYKRPPEIVISKMGAYEDSLDNLILKTRDFYREAGLRYFDDLIKATWLKSQFTYDGNRIKSSPSNGFYIDTAYAFFMKGMVGFSGKMFMDSVNSYSVRSYIPDFFPEFLEYDPFVDKEYFKFPYENIGIGHLALVFKCDERLEMLDYAEKHGMNIRDFTNWVVNWVVCYNNDVGKKVYEFVDSYRHRESPVVRKVTE